VQPRDRVAVANRLRHHLLEWGDAGAVVLLLHGFLEHAHVWDWVAPRLAEAGYHAFALDWRGHGDSAWVGAGGYYHFADYVADLGGLVRALGGRAALVAHSMGGNAAVLYAGPSRSA
jgi:alpha-beta hydrolase superfamily lysophospholipase